MATRSKRGPKVRTTNNARKQAANGGYDLWQGFRRPSGLPANVGTAFDHISLALKAAGTRERTTPMLALQLARIEVLMEECWAMVEAEGISRDAHNGAPMQHPQLKTLNSMLMRYKSILSECGLTPAASKSASATGSDDEDEGSTAWSKGFSVLKLK